MTKRKKTRIGTCSMDAKGRVVMAPDFFGDKALDLSDLQATIDGMKLPKELRLPDSGQRRAFSTGSVRDMATGKGRFDLIPEELLIALAEHYEAGAVKYGDNNWLKGQPFSVFFDSAFRHLVKAKKERRLGSERAPDKHLISAIWNLGAILTLEMRGRDKELNDLREGGE